MKCPFCINYNEDKYHIIFDCPSYNDLRPTSHLPIDFSVDDKQYRMFSIMHEFSLVEFNDAFNTIRLCKRQL